MSDLLKPNGTSGALPSASAKSQEQWREHCAELLSEIERLRLKNAALLEQRRAYASMIPIPDELKQLAEMPVDELLAMCEGQPTLEEFIRELEKETAK